MSDTAPNIDILADIHQPNADRRLQPDYQEEQLDIVEALQDRTGSAKARTVSAFNKAHTLEKISSTMTAADIERVAGAIGVDVTKSQTEMISYLRHQTELLGMTIAKIGVGLAALKERLDHGQFEVAVEEIGLAPRRAQECMQIARFLASQPNDRLKRFSELPKSKVLELAKAEPEVLEDYLNSESEEGEHEELEGLSVRDLRNRLRELKEQKQRLADDLTRSEMERDTLSKELKAAGYERYKQSLNNQSPCLLEIREESLATSDLMLAGIHHLRHLYEQKLGPMAADAFSQPPNPRAYLDDEGQRQARHTAAATLYHNLSGAVAPVLQLIRELEQAYGDTIGEATLAHMYDEAELVVFQEKRAALLAADEAARRQREASRHNASTKGQRGRPRKVEEV